MDERLGKLPSLRLKRMPISTESPDPSFKNFLRKLKAAELALSLSQKAKKINKSILQDVQSICENSRDEAIGLLENGALEKQVVDGYCASCLFVALGFLLEFRLGRKKKNEIKAIAGKSLRALDLALLRSGSEKWRRAAKPLLAIASKAQSLAFSKYHIPQDFEKKEPLNVKVPPQYIHESFARDIPRIDANKLTIEEFSKVYMESAQPVIICHAIDSWPAMYLWNQLDYLKERAEGRLLPIEITSKNDAGRSFMSSSWSHKFMGLDEYIESYVMPSNEINDHGYLAQHPLFEQIPELKKDVSIPIYCNSRTKQDYDAPPGTIIANDPLVSAWFGGHGTVSPIHNDPYHNTLAQIVGSKYIRIYDTDQSHRLYPKLNHLGHNSQVDVEAPDYTVFPLFKDTPCWQTILTKGELLYIPRNAWHYVRSLETSFSASFWFGAKMELSDDGAFRSSYLTE